MNEHGATFVSTQVTEDPVTNTEDTEVCSEPFTNKKDRHDSRSFLDIFLITCQPSHRRLL